MSPARRAVTLARWAGRRWRAKSDEFPKDPERPPKDRHFLDKGRRVFYLCPVRSEGAYHQWRKIPPRKLSIDLVADERSGWVTGRVGLVTKAAFWAVERSSGP